MRPDPILSPPRGLLATDRDPVYQSREFSNTVALDSWLNEQERFGRKLHSVSYCVTQSETWILAITVPA